MRRLIINADDFGLTAGVNRGIVESHVRGVVTSATIMANAAAFADAVRLAKATPTLATGCHVVLVDGSPLVAREQVPTLLAKRARPRSGASGKSRERGKQVEIGAGQRQGEDPAKVRSRDAAENVEGGEHPQARFRDSVAAFGVAALLGRLSGEEIEREARAQFEKLRAAGIRPTHFDSHKHAHMFAEVLKPLLRAAAGCGIWAVRNPFTPARELAWAHVVRRPKLWTRYGEVKALGAWAEGFRRAVREAGLRTTDGTFGVVVTGALDARLFEAIVGSLPEGTWEFVCHPGYRDADLDRERTRLRKSREVELEVLTSERAREALRRAGVELVNYGEI